MKATKIILVCLLATFMLNAQEDSLKKEMEYPFAEPGSEVSRGVFGKDDRKEVKDAEGYEDFVRATAVMIPKSSIYNDEFYSWSLRERLARQFKTNKFADNVKFLDQPALANCSGFLIAPGIMATAGHCVKNTADAKKYVWVFDYTSESKFINGRRLNFKGENIFEVEEVIISKLDEATDDDYAFIRLKRPSKRAPYRFRTSGKVLDKTKVNTIGSPTGLPLKFSTNAVVEYNKPKNWFKSNIDSFPGNSGGPVFDQNGFIEGILVRGAVTYSAADGRYTGDYKYNPDCDCIETVQWNSSLFTAGCQTHRITQVPANILITAVYENVAYAIQNNLKARLDTWDRYQWIFKKKYNSESNSLEMLALNSNNNYALETVLRFSADERSDSFSRQLIDKAIAKNNLNGLRIILDSGILADAGQFYTYTALQNAVRANRFEVAEMLISYGANTKVKTKNKDNLLHLAAKRGDYLMINLLAKNGVSANAKNNDRDRPEKVARKAGFRAVKKYLKKIRKGRINF